MVVSRFEATIDKWIHDNDAGTGRKELFELNGKRKELDVYRLPIDLLRYNIRNGRFAAELRELEARLERHLNPEVEEDAAQIRDLLLRDQTQSKYLKDDILRVGQLRPGVITRDGAIIDGNRRVAVLQQLFNERGEDRFQYFDTVRLPGNVSPKDIWKIEAGFQLSTDLKVSYGPVNELLKIKEGLEAGLDEREVAFILGGGDTEETVKEKVQRLSLIEAYLEFIGQPLVYSKAERRVEHFIDLQHIMASPAYRRLDDEIQKELISVAFEFIRGGVSHLRIRHMLKISKDAKVAAELVAKTTPYISKGSAQAAEFGGAISTESTKDAALIEQILGAERKATSSTPGALAVDEEADDDEVEPESGGALTTAKEAEERKRLYNEFIADGVDAVEARKREAMPSKTLRKAQRAIELLNESGIDKLKPLRRELEKLKKEIERIIALIRD